MNTHPWNQLIAGLPGAHLLQTWEWGQQKVEAGWMPYAFTWIRRADDSLSVQPFEPGVENKPPAAACLLLIRSARLFGTTRMSIAYAPKGPLLDWSDASLFPQVLSDLIALARQKGALFLKIDPDVEIGHGIPGEDFQENQGGMFVRKHLHETRWQFSRDQVQYRNTVLVDLSQPEEKLFANLKQKFRYNVNLAIRKGVTIHPASQDEFHNLYQLYAQTSIRDGFVIRNQEYYLRLWNEFYKAGMMDALFAEAEGRPIAALTLFRFAGTAIYMHGMSGQEHRDWMPNHLLQWEAIRRAKAAGCHTYDLWGAPDEFNENDPLWGVFRFKNGLGGQVTHRIGAWDFPLQPLYFKLYVRVLPALLDWMRRRGRRQTRAAVAQPENAQP